MEGILEGYYGWKTCPADYLYFDSGMPLKQLCRSHHCHLILVIGQRRQTGWWTTKGRLHGQTKPGTIKDTVQTCLFVCCPQSSGWQEVFAVWWPPHVPRTESAAPTVEVVGGGLDPILSCGNLTDQWQWTVTNMRSIGAQCFQQDVWKWEIKNSTITQ